MTIEVSNDLLDIATIEWRVDQTRSQPTLRQWAVIYPSTKHNDKLLMAYCRELSLPDPMNVGFGNRDTLNELLEYVNGPLVLVGPSALASWRPDLLAAKCAWTLDGHCGVWWDTRAILPARELDPPKGIPPFKLLERLLRGEDPIGDCVSSRCVRCGNSASRWDRDAVPYCDAHFAKEGSRWLEVRETWAKTENPSQPF